MTLSITDIKYNLYDPETNPNDDIRPCDLGLPVKLLVDQSTIDELYQGDFNVDRDIIELISCHTGFDPCDFKFTFND